MASDGIFRTRFRQRRFRAGYAIGTILLLAIEIGIALFVSGGPLRSHGGDVLAVILVYCATMAGTELHPVGGVASALAIATGLELAQGLHLLQRLGLPHRGLVGVVLGSSFDLRDFLAYAVGGMLVLGFERFRRRE